MSTPAPAVPATRIETVLNDWRSKTLNSMLLVATVVGVPALVATIAHWLEFGAWYGPVFFGAVYVLLAALTLFRGAFARRRGWLLLSMAYGAAMFALATTGLTGLGRILLVLVPVLAYILINPAAGWIATGLSLFIYLAVGLMAYAGLLNNPIIAADSPRDPVTWAMSGGTMTMVLLAAMIVVDRFYHLLMNALVSERRAALELEQAYNSTLEGWARALELFDRETESHSRHVTELTMQLARRMGISTEELIDMYRGALLHDIGKMGVPEAVLMKPGELDEREREEMKKHPDYAYQMLSPINFLKKAVDIPYCHHEKWDGTGYPRGLKGEEIPLAARIFTVIDVWDALTTKRPYHNPWPPEQARDYIRDRAGSHFDPRVVEAFINLALC